MQRELHPSFRALEAVRNPSGAPSIEEKPEAYGLPFPPSQLERVRETIHLLPIAEQAKYANAVVRARIAEPAYYVQQLEHGMVPKPNEPWMPQLIERYGPVHIGNLAYVALHSPFVDRKQQWLGLHSSFVPARTKYLYQQARNRSWLWAALSVVFTLWLALMIKLFVL